MSLYINSFQVVFRLIISGSSQQTYKEIQGIGKGSFKSQKLEKGPWGIKKSKEFTQKIKITQNRF